MTSFAAFTVTADYDGVIELQHEPCPYWSREFRDYPAALGALVEAATEHLQQSHDGDAT